MTLTKCPGCDSLINSIDGKCSICGFALPLPPAAIQKPARPLPESSFADLSEPDYGGVLPSHSRTPQMMARLGAARQAGKQTGSYKENTFQTPTPPKINAPVPALPEPTVNAPKIDAANGFQNSGSNPVAVPKAKSNLMIILVVVGVAVVLAAIAGISLLFFLLR